jgi:uncharacterized repeat protein (TIGR01451 family)
MKAAIHVVRRSLALGVCACILVSSGETSRLSGDGPGAAPPLEGPVLPPPVSDCLPKDPPPPVLKLKVRVPAEAAPGQDIRYHLCIENCSTSEAHHVVVKDALPANARFVRADPMPSAQEPELQWQLGTIGAGAVREIILVLQPTNNEDIKNCARVQFEHGLCVVTRQAGLAPGQAPGAVLPRVVPVPPPGTPPSPPPGTPPSPPRPGPGTKPPVVKELPPVVDADAPRLALTMEGHPQQYVNLPSRYFLTVTNTSKFRATTILLRARLPEKTKFVSASDKGQQVENQVGWFLGSLDPGAKRTVELDLRAGEAGRWCIKADVLADRNVKANAEFCTEFLGVSALTIDLTDREDPIIVGARTTYVIQVGNPGSAAVTKLQLRARIPPGMQVVRTNPSEYQKGKADAAGQWLDFTMLPELAAKKQVTYEVTVEATRVGEQRFRVELSADQLELGPIVEDENTTVFEDEADLRKNAPLP